jgi:hypothetical protein
MNDSRNGNKRSSIESKNKNKGIAVIKCISKRDNKPIICLWNSLSLKESFFHEFLEFSSVVRNFRSNFEKFLRIFIILMIFPGVLLLFKRF